MEPWLTQALVGTAKQGALADSHEHPVLALAGQLAESGAERRPLLGAGAASIYATAGRKTRADVPLPQEAPREVRAYCSPRATALVREILEQSTIEAKLLSLAFELLDTAQQILPPALIPQVLMIPSRSRQYVQVRGVLGERGRWLAQFCDDWKWAFQHLKADGEQLPSDADRIWQEGELSVRVELLALARRVDSAKAREWLAAVWNVEKAEARQKMLGTFNLNLSADDVPLLEQGLKDRSGAVRSQAARWLARIVDSPFAIRMRQRAEALLTFTPPARTTGVASKIKSLAAGNAGIYKLEVALPESCPKDWIQDGVELKPTTGVGERTFWFSQIVSLIPPAHWSQRFGVEPAELLAAAAGHDHEAAIVTSWLVAAKLHASVDWLAALWDRSFAQLKAGKRAKPSDVSWEGLLYSCVEAMPPAATESRAIKMIAEFGDRDGWVLQGFTEHLPTPWSDALALAVVDWLRAACSRKDGHKLVPAKQMFLLDAALALPISQADKVLALEPHWDDDSHDYAKSMLSRLQQTLRFRQQLHASIAST